MIPSPGLSVNFLKKESYTGSYRGIRYYLDAADGAVRACVYPEPFCFEKTPEEQKTWASFPLSPEGIAEALNWIEDIWKKR